MSLPLAPDVCVIGAGSAGLTVAAGARAVGLSVVLVEEGAMGGECLNTGCVPSKALIAAARHAEAIRRAGAFGVTAGPPTVDAAAVAAHLRSVIASIAPHDSVERFEGLGAVVLRARARFTGPDELVAGGTAVRARRFVVATGSRPLVPDVPGLTGLPILTNESVFDLAALPARLLVLGAGAVAMELAQAFRRLGSAVTVLARSTPLSREDPELAAVVTARLEAEGVVIRRGIAVLKAEGARAGFRLTLSDGTAVEGDALLVAAGRRANVDGLGLDTAGIAHDARGIPTDAALRTNNRRVFAIGDVGRNPRFTHWAGHQGSLVVRTILTGWPARLDPDVLPAAIFTDPELARVGLSEAEARARHGDAVTIHRAPFSENDRARTDREAAGLVKIVAGPRGRILGAGIVGPNAGEVLAPLALAVGARLSVTDLARTVLPYPTLAEAVRRASVAALSDRLRAPGAQRLLGLVRWFGRRIG